MYSILNKSIVLLLFVDIGYSTIININSKNRIVNLKDKNNTIYAIEVDPNLYKKKELYYRPKNCSIFNKHTIVCKLTPYNYDIIVNEINIKNYTISNKYIIHFFFKRENITKKYKNKNNRKKIKNIIPIKIFNFENLFNIKFLSPVFNIDYKKIINKELKERMELKRKIVGSFNIDLFNDKKSIMKIKKVFNIQNIKVRKYNGINKKLLYLLKNSINNINDKNLKIQKKEEKKKVTKEKNLTKILKSILINN